MMKFKAVVIISLLTGLLLAPYAVAERSSTYGYDASTGLLQTIDGPRTDVADITTLNYDPDTGNLISVTNALGQRTDITEHDARGRPAGIIDPNGREITLTFHPRGWLLQRVDDGVATDYEYDREGQLTRTTLSNGAYLQYEYDSAHRLIEISDRHGNRIHYTLDAMGNMLHQEIFDKNNQLTFQLAAEYDQLSRLQLQIGGAGQLTRYSYNAQGSLTAQSDPRHTSSDSVAALAQNPANLANTRINHYDALQRLIAVTRVAAEVGGDDAREYQYNALDQLEIVTDPNGLETRYHYNALGDLLQQDSPDTGETHYGYDDAGNLTSRLDANGNSVSYHYDALNRLTEVDYAGDALDIHYRYDENDAGQFGIGRLTGIIDGGGETRFWYDRLGNLLSSSSTRDGITHHTQYAYDEANQLIQITYPSARQVDYTRDDYGRVIHVSTRHQGLETTLLDEITYQAFGAKSAWEFGNGLTESDAYDLAYRLIGRDNAPLSHKQLYYDAADNLITIENTFDNQQNQDFEYDGLERLIAADGIYGAQGYDYDDNGNRLSRTDSVTSTAYGYAENSHRLLNIGAGFEYDYDANGNLLNDGDKHYHYDARNRLSEVTQNGVLATYTYNSDGQRVKKTIAGTVSYYHYDRFGLLIAETDAQGNTLQEYFYLQGQPIALTAIANNTDPQHGPDIILDNSDASTGYDESWSMETLSTGYYGSDYLLHAAQNSSVFVGVPLDNVEPHFTTSDSWPQITRLSGFIGDDYQYHKGKAYPLVIGEPVDNDSPGFSFTGSMRSTYEVNGYHGSNYYQSPAGTGDKVAIWQIAVTESGQYDLYANWVAGSGHASDAVYSIYHSDGVNTVTVNQQQNGGTWQLLGTYPLTANTAHRIELSNAANGIVIADAVTLLPAGTPPIGRKQSPQTATWALDISDAGDYDVYAIWTLIRFQATESQYTIHHSEGTDTVTVNQKQNAGIWQKLGSFPFDAGTGQRIVLSDEANGVVVADAVSLLPAGATPFITAPPPIVTWRPQLNDSSEYEVYAQWPADSNHSEQAVYTVHHADGDTSHTVNQQQNGGQWQLLGTYILDEQSTITLAAATDGTVAADAIRLAPLSDENTPSGNPEIYHIHNNHLGTPQIITDSGQQIVWQANYDPFGRAVISTEKITNPLRFPGQYYDKETGLHYNWRRYYDPNTGRYITSDPIGLAGGLNSYAYVAGNPISLYDPYGLFGMDDVWSGIYWFTGDRLPNQTFINLSVGFGDGVSSVLTLGLYNTADFRDDFDIDGGVNECTASYEYSKYAGYAWGVGTTWAGGLSGGSNSVFWSGFDMGAMQMATRVGKTLGNTPIGAVMNLVSRKIHVPEILWDAASLTFAANARGPVKAIIRNSSSLSVWTRIELRVLKWRGNTINYL